MQVDWEQYEITGRVGAPVHPTPTSPNANSNQSQDGQNDGKGKLCGPLCRSATIAFEMAALAFVVHVSRQHKLQRDWNVLLQQSLLDRESASDSPARVSVVSTAEVKLQAAASLVHNQL